MSRRDPKPAPAPTRIKQGPLTGKQRRALRAKGHHLHALVHVGSSGVTEGVVGALEDALVKHELVKVQIADEREARARAAVELAERTDSAIAQEMGKTVLFFRKRPQKSGFEDL